jgi:hypothetical protein
LQRATCSKRENCRAPSWTVYPPGRYPHRRFHLDVVAQAVALAAHGRDAEDRRLSRDTIGRRYACSGRTVSRWTLWVAEITDIEALARTCIRLDPDGMPAAPRPDAGGVRARAGQALAVFDQFAALLERRSVLTPTGAPALVRILDDQRLRHGVRFPLRVLCPPLSGAPPQTLGHGRGPPVVRRG